MRNDELVLVSRYDAPFMRGLKKVLGYIFNVCTFLSLYNRTYLFFYLPHEYKNRKILYKWLSNGNKPTRGEFFELFKTWTTGEYTLRIWGAECSCEHTETGEIVMAGYNPSDADKKLHTEIWRKLLELSKEDS